MRLGVRGMTSDSDDLEEQLRQNFALRRRLGAELAKAEDSDEPQSLERPGRSALGVGDRGHQRDARARRYAEVAEPAPVKDDLEALRDQLKSRDLARESAAAAQQSTPHQGGVTLPGALKAPDAALDSGDDFAELRRTLKQRGERGDQVADTEETHSKSPPGTAYWIGQGFFWSCFTLGLIWMAGYSFVVINSPMASDQLLTPGVFAVIIVPALLLSGIGRDLRYLLSGT